MIKRYALLAVIAFALHGVWEYVHLPLYGGYEGISGSMPILLYATLGDVLYTLLIVGGISLILRDSQWLGRPRIGGYSLLAAVGFLLAVAVEYKGLALHRWVYLPAMPTLFGFGLSPLLQMTLLLPLSVYLSRWAAEYIFDKLEA